MKVFRLFIVLLVEVTLAFLYISRFHVIPKNSIRTMMDSTENQQGSHDNIIHLVVEHYIGQQGTGINEVASLQCWTGSLGLNISIVEPCIRNTTIVGVLDQSLESNNTMVLGDYFDILEHINNVSRRLGMSGIITLNEALSKPLKKVVYVKTKTKTEDTRVLWSSDPKNSCYKNTKHGVTRIRVNIGVYCILRIVAITQTNLIKQNLSSILGPYYNKGITLVISRWGTLRNVGGISRLTSCTGEYVIPWSTPSKMLLQHAKNYEDTYLQSKNTLAIMVRVEHMLKNNLQHKEDTAPRCFENVTKIIKQHGTYPLMIAADVGVHGSNSFNWFVKDQSSLHKAITLLKNIIPVWLNKQFSFEEWEASFVKSANGIINPGYIAALQRIIATRADCLVLVGGGKFQELALRGYLHQHEDRRKRCLQFICIHYRARLVSIVNSRTA